MDAFLAAVAVVTVGAITPGPNNLIVMRAAARGGVRGALPAIAGIVLGSVALVSLVLLGGDIAFRAAPRARPALAIAGCAYLAWLGSALAIRSFRAAPPRADLDPTTPRAAGVAGLFAFQFLNPKSWAMAFTAVATLTGSPAAVLVRLAAIFALVPAVCLLIWSSAGSLLATALRRPRARAWFDRAMAAVLVGSAILLLLET